MSKIKYSHFVVTTLATPILGILKNDNADMHTNIERLIKMLHEHHVVEPEKIYLEDDKGNYISEISETLNTPIEFKVKLLDDDELDEIIIIPTICY